MRKTTSKKIVQEIANYPTFLEHLKVTIKTAQTKAILSVNSELIKLYWDIGRSIVEKQKGEEWKS